MNKFLKLCFYTILIFNIALASSKTLTINGTGDSQELLTKLGEKFETFRDEDEAIRHKKWLDSIKNGDFSFGSVDLKYIAKGEGSWKYQAIKQDKAIDQDDDMFEFADDFMDSDWRLFHVALKAHRFDLINNILPKYGICVS